MENMSNTPDQIELDVILSQPLYEDSQIDNIIQSELGCKYESRKIAHLREAIEVEVFIYVAFAFALTQVASGFLREIGKDLYTTTKRIFQRKREDKTLTDSSPAFFHANVKVGDIEVKLVFQTDAYSDSEGFGAIFDRVMNGVREMVEQDTRLQRCKEVTYEWNHDEKMPMPWQAIPRDFPSETREYYEWNGIDWELRNLDNRQ